MQQLVTFENSSCVRIHYKNGMIPGVKQDGIRGLRADAVNLQELFSAVCPSERQTFYSTSPHSPL